MIDWVAYAHARSTVKGAEETFGTGDIRGVIASESANNAREGGALVPTIAFGVPGTATMALLISLPRPRAATRARHAGQESRASPAA